MEYVGICLLVLISIILAYIVLLGISALFVNPKKEYEKNNRYYRLLLNSATACSMHLLRIRIHVRGIENVPKNCRFLLVCNHRSNFDPIVTWHVLREYDIAYISKAENFNIPVFGRIIRRCAFLSIDRDNPRNALKTINKAAQMMKDNSVSIGVYPEGTRSKNCVLLPFHDGVFKIAQKAKAPIVVSAIRGTENIHRNWYRRHTDVYLDFVKILQPEELVKLRTAEIGAQIYSQLSCALGSAKFD